jgi:hypothetical protein
VDQIEAASGFDVLSALRDDIEIAVESNTVPPQASLDGPWSAYAGDPLALSGAASTDADGDGLTYAWDFGDGSTAEGATASHTYATAGEYAVRLIVTDVRGLADTVTSTASITPLPTVVGLDRAIAYGRSLSADGIIKVRNSTALVIQLETARKQFLRGNLTAVPGNIQGSLAVAQAFVTDRKLTEEQIAPFVELLNRVLAGL